MDDTKNTSLPNDQQNISQSSGTGTQKESEPMPSGTIDFSELSAPEEKASEMELSSENETQTTDVGSGAALHPLPAGTHEAKDAKQPNTQQSASAQQAAMTQKQAQQIVKGPLIFKRSSDPMLWLAFLMIRHYQWLAHQEKKQKS